MLIFEVMNFNSVNEYFSKINQFYHLILVTPLTIFCYIYLEKGAGGWDSYLGNPLYTTIATYFLAVVSIVLIILAFRNFREQIKRAGGLSLREKLEIYYYTFLNQQVLMTSGGFLAICALYITGYSFFSAIYLVSLFASSIQRPSSHRIVKVLNLKGEDKEIILKKKPIPNA